MFAIDKRRMIVSKINESYDKLQKRLSGLTLFYAMRGNIYLTDKDGNIYTKHVNTGKSGTLTYPTLALYCDRDCPHITGFDWLSSEEALVMMVEYSTANTKEIRKSIVNGINRPLIDLVMFEPFNYTDDVAKRDGFISRSAAISWIVKTWVDSKGNYNDMLQHMATVARNNDKKTHKNRVIPYTGKDGENIKPYVPASEHTFSYYDKLSEERYAKFPELKGFVLGFIQDSIDIFSTGFSVTLSLSSRWSSASMVRKYRTSIAKYAIDGLMYGAMGLSQRTIKCRLGPLNLYSVKEVYYGRADTAVVVFELKDKLIETLQDYTEE